MSIIRNYPPRGMYIYKTFKGAGYSIGRFAQIIGVEYAQVHRWVSQGKDMQCESLKLVCQGLARITDQDWEYYALEILRR